MTKIEQLAQEVRRSGDFTELTKEQVIKIQEYALNVKDIELYDFLELYWRMKR